MEYRLGPEDLSAGRLPRSCTKFKSSFSIVLMCTSCLRIPASASTYRGIGKDDLTTSPQSGVKSPFSSHRSVQAPAGIRRRLIQITAVEGTIRCTQNRTQVPSRGPRTRPRPTSSRKSYRNFPTPDCWRGQLAVKPF